MNVNMRTEKFSKLLGTQTSHYSRILKKLRACSFWYIYSHQQVFNY